MSEPPQPHPHPRARKHQESTLSPVSGQSCSGPLRPSCVKTLQTHLCTQHMDPCSNTGTNTSHSKAGSTQERGDPYAHTHTRTHPSLLLLPCPPPPPPHGPTYSFWGLLGPLCRGALIPHPSGCRALLSCCCCSACPLVYQLPSEFVCQVAGPWSYGPGSLERQEERGVAKPALWGFLHLQKLGKGEPWAPSSQEESPAPALLRGIWGGRLRGRGPAGKQMGGRYTASLGCPQRGRGVSWGSVWPQPELGHSRPAPSQCSLTIFLARPGLSAPAPNLDLGERDCPPVPPAHKSWQLLGPPTAATPTGSDLLGSSPGALAISGSDRHPDPGRWREARPRPLKA